jgi:DNA-binding LytR/AlgR family response regulator
MVDQDLLRHSQSYLINTQLIREQQEEALANIKKRNAEKKMRDAIEDLLKELEPDKEQQKKI